MYDSHSTPAFAAYIEYALDCGCRQDQGAGGETRTPTGSRPVRCERTASADSATPAPLSGMLAPSVQPTRHRKGQCLWPRGSLSGPGLGCVIKALRALVEKRE